MKKSLSLLLAIAMVFTMFSGVAFAADNGSDNKAKLYDAGVLKGSLSGDTLDDATWTRQNVTVLLSRLYDVEAEAQATAKGHTFTDVTDPYYDGFITWAVEEGLFTGHSDVRFGYNEDITAQQFAAVLLRALGVDHEYADAVEAAVEAGILAEELDNDSAVLRGASYDILVATLDVVDEDGKSLGERLGLEGWVPEVPAISATPVGVQTVEVKLSSAVDTDDAKVEIKRGNTPLSADVEWSEDGKTATISLEVKIVEADYTVTISEVSDEDLVASFSADNERVESINFTNSSEEIARSPKVTKLVEARNQYGELASFSGGGFDFFAPENTVQSLIKNDDGYLELTIKTDHAHLQTGIGVLPITVYVQDTRLSVQRTFTIGTPPLVDELQLGELEYSNNDHDALVSSGDTVKIPLTKIDQYGDVITSGSGITPNTNAFVTPYEQHLSAPVVTEFDNVTFTLDENVEKSGEYTVTVYSGTAQATTEIEIRSSKLATEVQFDQFTGTIAAGDQRDHHVGIVAYDENGEKLSADDIVDNASRFNISVSGADKDGSSATVNGIVKHGEHKGKLRLTNVIDTRGTIHLNIGIYTANVQSQNSMNIPVNAARVPETIVVDSPGASKAIAGGTSEFKLIVRDQYGEKLDDVDVNNSDYVNEYVIQIVTPLTATNGTTVSGDKAIPSGGTYLPANFGDFNEGFEFDTTLSTVGKAEFKVELRKITGSDPAADYQVLRTVTRSIDTISNTTELTYSVKQVDALFAFEDHGATPGADQSNPFGSKYAQKLEVTAKDKAGNEVAIPDSVGGNYRISDVVTSNTSVVTAVYNAGPTEFKLAGFKDAGTANATVTFIKDNGESATANLTITVRNDRPTVDSLSNDATAVIDTTKNAQELMDLKVKDSYGIEFDSQTDINKYDVFLGIRYSVSGVKVSDGSNASVSVNPITGVISITGGPVSEVEEFELTATANNGQQVTTVIGKTN